MSQFSAYPNVLPAPVRTYWSPAVGSVLAFPAFASTASVVVVLRRRAAIVLAVIVRATDLGLALQEGGASLFSTSHSTRQPAEIGESNALATCGTNTSAKGSCGSLRPRLVYDRGHGSG